METKPCYIGIDPATKTSCMGVVALTEDLKMQDSISLHFSVPPPGFATPGLRWDPVLTYAIEFARSELMIFMRSQPLISAIFIEEPTLLGKANKNMMKLLGVLENSIWGEYLSVVPIHYINPATSKKLVGGHGSADKEQVLKGVLKHTKCHLGDFIESNLVCYDLSDAAAAVVAGIMLGGINHAK